MSSILDPYLTHTPHNERRCDVIAYLAALDHLQTVFPEIATQIRQELDQQRSTLKLIASENYSSLSVQLAMGNLLSDKYSEGAPYHRFYAGCEHIDAIESQAVSLAKELFGASHAYVQPHSGADANLVAFWAALTQRVQSSWLSAHEKKGLEELSSAEFEALRQKLGNQTLMGMGIGSGGHLTHGFRHNISAKMFRAVAYEVDPKTHLLDYSAIAEMAKREKPFILLAGYSAYPRRINFAKMRAIADEVGSVLIADMAHFAGLVAGKLFQGEENPVPYAHIVTSTTHKTLRGPRGGFILCTEEFKESVDKGCPLVLGGPLPHVIAAKAVGFKENAHPSFQDYAARVVDNSRHLAESLMRLKLNVVTQGTDNHLVLVNLSALNLTGKIAESCLSKTGITLNRNMVPFDPNGAWYTSGIRMGSAALTTRGMGKQEMEEIAAILALVLHNIRPVIVEKTGRPSKVQGFVDEHVLGEAKTRVNALLASFPLYPELPKRSDKR